jgi:hypothetical protein
MNRRLSWSAKIGYTFLLALLGGLPLLSSAQTQAKEWHINEVGWTLRLPPGNKLDTTQLDSLFDAARTKIKPIALETGGLHVLFTVLLPPYDAFGAALAPYDSSLYPDWAVFHGYAKNQAMAIFAAQAPKMTVMDTASTVEAIGGLAFQRFYIKTYFPEKQVTTQTYWFACRRGGYDFSINISYANEATGQQFLDILRHSSFAQ